MKLNNWAIFISGRGSNLQSLLDLIDNNRIKVIYSSSETAHGLLKAKRFGVPAKVLPKPIDWSFVTRDLISQKISHIFLLGFMKIVPEEFINAWKGKIYNLHPSLLPDFPGLHAIEKNLASDKDMGVTVHNVVPEVDAGEVLLQKITIKNADKIKYSENQIRHLISVDEQRLVRELFLND